MSTYPDCPQCGSKYAYPDGTLLVCPECGHEWSAEAPAEGGDAPRVWRDANGNELHDGDSVTVIKDLKIKGSSSVVKVGTKVKNIRLVEGPRHRLPHRRHRRHAAQVGFRQESLRLLQPVCRRARKSG